MYVGKYVSMYVGWYVCMYVGMYVTCSCVCDRFLFLLPALELQYFYTDRSKAVLLLWSLTVTCSCYPYLYFASAIMLVTYFVNFR